MLRELFSKQPLFYKQRNNYKRDISPLKRNERKIIKKNKISIIENKSLNKKSHSLVSTISTIEELNTKNLLRESAINSSSNHSTTQTKNAESLPIGNSMKNKYNIQQYVKRENLGRNNSILHNKNNNSLSRSLSMRQIDNFTNKTFDSSYCMISYFIFNR